MQSENYFELRAQLLSVDQANSSFDFSDHVDDDAIPIRLQVWVDGLQLEEGVAVDIWEVLYSTLKSSRESFIFSCGCGHWGCAGIDDGVSVSHAGPFIIWQAKLPLLTKRRSGDHPFGVETTFRFLKSQMIDECRGFVAAARLASGGKLSRVRVPVYERSLEKLFQRSRFKWARR